MVPQSLFLYPCSFREEGEDRNGKERAQEIEGGGEVETVECFIVYPLTPCLYDVDLRLEIRLGRTDRLFFFLFHFVSPF